MVQQAETRFIFQACFGRLQRTLVESAVVGQERVNFQIISYIFHENVQHNCRKKTMFGKIYISNSDLSSPLGVSCPCVTCMNHLSLSLSLSSRKQDRLRTRSLRTACLGPINNLTLYYLFNQDKPITLGFFTTYVNVGIL